MLLIITISKFIDNSKGKQNKLMFNECLLSDKDKAKVYTQFFRPK